jgi:hypothetical protein
MRYLQSGESLEKQMEQNKTKAMIRLEWEQ